MSICLKRKALSTLHATTMVKRRHINPHKHAGTLYSLDGSKTQLSFSNPIVAVQGVPLKFRLQDDVLILETIPTSNQHRLVKERMQNLIHETKKRYDELMHYRKQQLSTLDALTRGSSTVTDAMEEVQHCAEITQNHHARIQELNAQFEISLTVQKKRTEAILYKEELTKVSFLPMPVFWDRSQRKPKAAVEKVHRESVQTTQLTGEGFAFGFGVDSNTTEGARRMELAKKANNDRATAWCYAAGYGVEKNEIKAARLYRASAEKGDADAQCCLGTCYVKGTGVEQDEKEAVRWYRMASEQGLARAQFNLGRCYADGVGVTKSPDEALRWCHLAAAQVCELSDSPSTSSQRRREAMFALFAESQFEWFNVILKAVYDLDPTMSEYRQLTAQGDSILHYAARVKHVKQVQYLLKNVLRDHAPKLMNHRNHDGVTPLHVALNYNQPEMFQFLLQQNADPRLTSTQIPDVFARAKTLWPELRFDTNSS